MNKRVGRPLQSPARQKKRPVGSLPPSVLSEKPHRPGIAPALGLRAGWAAPILEQTTIAKETPMWFRSLFDVRELDRPASWPNTSFQLPLPRRPAQLRSGAAAGTVYVR